MLTLFLSAFACALNAYLLYWFNKRPKDFPPGPLGIPILGSFPFLGQFPHKTFIQLAKKYGNVFSVYFGSYPVVVLNDFEVIKEAYRGDDFLGRPMNMASMARIEEGNMGLGFSEGDVWQKQRRFTNKALRDSCYGNAKENLDEDGKVWKESRVETVIKNEIDRIESDFINAKGKPIRFRNVFEPYLMRVMWKLVSNDSSESEVRACDEEARSVLDTYCKGMFDAPLLVIVYFMPWISKLVNLFKENKFQKLLAPPIKLMENLIQEHKNTFEEGQLTDFVYSYLNEIHGTEDSKSSFYQGKGLKNLTYTLVDLFLAGFETTGTSLEWILLILLKHPDVMKKLQAEVDSVIGDRKPRYTDRNSMPFTQAVIAEALRFAAISPTGMMRKTLRDTQVRGHKIPKGTFVLPNFHNVHHDPKYWGEDAELFVPERFLTPEGQFRKDERLIVFGLGKRNCPGENLANTEMFLVLTSIVQKFNLKLHESSNDITLDPKVGLVLTTYPYNVTVESRKK